MPARCFCARIRTLMDPIRRLELAREALDAGRPRRGLSLMKGQFPSLLRPEKDFLTAECLRAQGYFDRAAALYRHLLRGRAADAGLKVESSLGLAAVYRSLGRVAEARRVLAGARGDEGFALEDALIDRAAGLYPRSLRKLARLLSSARRAKDHAAAGFLLWATGGARRFSGDLAGSRRDFLESLAAARRARDAAGEAYALFGLGGVTRIQGDLAASQRYYAEAGRLLAKTEDVFGQAYAHCGLANVLRQRGSLREAERHYRLAHGLYSSLGDAVDLAYVDWGLGKVHLRRGQLPAAEKRLRAALKGFARGDEARGLVLSEHALSTVLHARGRTAQAERLFDAAVRRARKAGLHAHLEIFT